MIHDSLLTEKSISNNSEFPLIFCYVKNIKKINIWYIINNTDLGIQNSVNYVYFQNVAKIGF